eukprot:853159-Alexandrium_andersonii.AAC.1
MSPWTKLPLWSGTSGGGMLSYGAALPQLVSKILAYVLGSTSPSSPSSPPSAGIGDVSARSAAGAPSAPPSAVPAGATPWS